jgi:RNA polymerase-binding transcription factor DksA
MLRVLSPHLSKTPNGDTVSNIIQRRKRVHEHPSHRDLLVFSMEDVRLALAESQRFRSEYPKESAIREKVEAKVSSRRRSKPPVVAIAGLADLLGFDPRRNATLPTKNIPSKFKKYYDRLLALKTKIQDPLSNPQTGGFDIDFALALIPSETEALQEIEKALDRIFDGTYGVCEMTGQAIDEERLLAIPFARCSLEGQAQKERQNRQHATDSERIFPEGIEDIPIVYDEETEIQE